MNDRLATKFHLLRGRIESEVKEPGVVMVTSAKQHDGKSFTAFGLAECLASIGHRVALVDANAGGRSVKESHAGGDPRRGLSIVSMPNEENGPTPSREAIGNFVAQLRMRFAFTVVDAAPLVRSSTAILLASESDGVLLTVRVGRAPCEEDGLTLGILKHARAPVFGVVAASGNEIDRFERTRESAYGSDSRVVLLEPQANDNHGEARVAVASFS